MPRNSRPADLPGLACWLKATPDGFRDMLTGEILVPPEEVVGRICTTIDLDGADAPRIIVTPPV